jgi:hypothetical protein
MVPVAFGEFTDKPGDEAAVGMNKKDVSSFYFIGIDWFRVRNISNIVF